MDAASGATQTCPARQQRGYWKENKATLQCLQKQNWLVLCALQNVLLSRIKK